MSNQKFPKLNFLANYYLEYFYRRYRIQVEKETPPS